MEREEILESTPNALTGGEQELFRAALERSQSSRNRALALLLLNAGLRVGEVAALDLGDLTIAEGQPIASIRSARSNRARVIALDEQTRNAVSDWLAERQQRFPESKEEALFLSNQKKRITTAGIDYLIRSIGGQIALMVSAEILRHTCLMNLVLQGKDIKLVRKLSGHKRLETTKRYAPPSITVCEDTTLPVSSAGEQSGST